MILLFKFIKSLFCIHVYEMTPDPWFGKAKHCIKCGKLHPLWANWRA